MLSRHTRSRRQAGLTMIELVVTVVLVGIVGVLGGLLLASSFQSYDVMQKTSDIDWQGRVALERMVRELRAVRANADLTMSAIATDPIFFVDSSGMAVCFCYESSTQSVRRGTSAAPNCGTGGIAPTATCGTGSTQPLADNIPASGLNFYYYTANGAAAASSAQVHLIALALTVTEGALSETYRVGVQPRSFP